MEPPNEIWKVDVDGAFYEADTETLKQWILDGHVTAQTKVQKGALKWIELGRAPAFRSLFTGAAGLAPPATPPADAWASAPAAPAYGFTPPEMAPNAFAPPAAPLVGGACLNHPEAPAKYLCQGCGAALCTPCVKRYGSAAVCTLCGELCRPMAEAAVDIHRQSVIAAGYGLRDFGLAVQYALKDPIALGITAVIYGFLLLFGIYGRLAAAGLLFGYMSHAIRRVSMGHYDEGPSPDLSDPGDLIFEAGKLGIGIALVTYGPLAVVALTTMHSLFDGDFDAVTTLGFGAVGIVIAGLWAAFYYPMALLVAGYTGQFLSTINPVVGLATMGRLGLDYVKAYGMCLAVFVAQVLIGATLGVIGRASEVATNTIVQALAYLVQYILQGAVTFFASMVIAALLGLVLFKRPDVVDLEV